MLKYGDLVQIIGLDYTWKYLGCLRGVCELSGWVRVATLPPMPTGVVLYVHRSDIQPVATTQQEALL